MRRNAWQTAIILTFLDSLLTFGGILANPADAVRAAGILATDGRTRADG